MFCQPCVSLQQTPIELEALRAVGSRATLRLGLCRNWAWDRQAQALLSAAARPGTDSPSDVLQRPIISR